MRYGCSRGGERAIGSLKWKARVGRRQAARWVAGDESADRLGDEMEMGVVV